MDWPFLVDSMQAALVGSPIGEPALLVRRNGGVETAKVRVIYQAPATYGDELGVEVTPVEHQVVIRASEQPSWLARGDEVRLTQRSPVVTLRLQSAVPDGQGMNTWVAQL